MQKKYKNQFTKQKNNITYINKQHLTQNKNIKKKLTLPSIKLKLYHTTFTPTYIPLNLILSIYILSKKNIIKTFSHISKLKKKISFKTKTTNISPTLLIIITLNNIYINLKSYHNTKTQLYHPNTNILNF